MKKVCPRCKLPQEGINECEYCGLVFREYKNEPTRKLVSATKKGAVSILRIVLFIIVGFAALIFIIPLIANLKMELFNNQQNEELKQTANTQNEQQVKPKRQQRKTQIKIKSPEEIRKDKIRKQLSIWDGSHRNLERIIKKAMNDPDSYDHEETVYWEQGEYLIVRTTFRGKNAFGGVVKNWVKAKVDIDGKNIQILEQGP